MFAFSRRLHPGLLVAALLTLVLSGLATVSNAAPPPPVADTITITRISTPSIPTAPGAPWSDVFVPFVVTGVPFTTDIAFTYLGQPTPLSTSKEVTITLTETVGPQAGTVLKTFKVPVGATSVSIPGTVMQPAFNGVTLEAKAGKGPTAIITTKSFDVLQEATGVNNGTTTRLSVGGTGGGSGTSCTPTAAKPWCSEMILPSANAVIDNRVVIAQGRCDGVCQNLALSFTQAIFDVNTSVVDSTHPIIVIVKCDKTQCPGDPKNYDLGVRLTPADPFTIPTVCAKAGEVDPGLDYCFDSQASNRDGAGDLIQVVLFLKDLSIARKP